MPRILLASFCPIRFSSNFLYHFQSAHFLRAHCDRLHFASSKRGHFNFGEKGHFYLANKYRLIVVSLDDSGYNPVHKLYRTDGPRSPLLGFFPVAVKVGAKVGLGAP